MKLFSIYPDLNHETLRRPGLAWNRNVLAKRNVLGNAAMLCNQTLCIVGNAVQWQSTKKYIYKQMLVVAWQDVRSTTF